MSRIDTAKLNDILMQGSESLSLTLTEQQAEKLVGYVERIDKWNKAYNLTSVREPEQMMVKHILDSIAVAPFIDGKTIIDVARDPVIGDVAGFFVHPAR